MKVRVTIMTENDKSLEILGVSKETFEEITRAAWQTLFDLTALQSSDPSERAVVEKCELVED